MSRLISSSLPLLLVAAAFAAQSLAYASDFPTLRPEYVAGGWRTGSATSVPVIRGEAPERALGRLAPSKQKAFAGIAEQAHRIVERNAALGLLLLERDGSVVFEEYARGADAGTLLLGASVTKSVTSLAVAHALCDGALKSLDDKAGTYSSALAGTTFGRSTIRELLTMTSAGPRSVHWGQPAPTFNLDVYWRRAQTLRAAIRQYGNGEDNWNHGSFDYKTLDTIVLGLLVTDAVGEPFHAYLSRTVWQRIGAQADSALLVDVNGDAGVSGFFGATLRDWGRFALYVLERMEDPGGACLATYLRDATRQQVVNRGRIGSGFFGYGYQFWVRNKHVRAPAFFMVGLGGQRIAVDPKSGRVLVLSAYVEDFMPEVYELFDRWTRI